MWRARPDTAPVPRANQPPTRPAPPGFRVPVAAVAACLVAVGGAAWWGVWRGGYVFDDHTAIARNAALIGGDWWNAAFGPAHQPLANRPLACLSLTVDFALFGTGPFGPHLGNLLLHLANAVLLLLTLRRALLSPNLRGRFDEAHALRIATVVAVLWVVHPMTAEAVAYATQRSTLLASAFLLLALFATVRAHGARRALGWRACGWLALACSMASKEDFVVGPLLVALFERAFLLPSWTALRTRWRWFAALATTWIVLLACVVLGPANPTVGYSAMPRVTAWQWLMTQAGVIVHYVVQVVWPAGLRTFYDWGIVRDLGRAALPGLVVLGLLVAVVACWRRYPWLGWLGALFFLLLAPTSSILPIVTELVAERRMYLPMLFVIVPAVLGATALLQRTAARTSRWLGPLLAIVVAVALAATTRVRIGAYVDDAAVWADAFAKRDPTSRTAQAAGILTNQAVVWKRQGRVEESTNLLDEAMLCEDMSEATVVQHAWTLMARNRHDEAIANMRRVVAIGGSANAWAVLGIALASSHQAARASAADPRLPEAEACIRRAIDNGVASAREWLWLGYASLAAGRLDAAEHAYATCARLSPDAAEPRIKLAEVFVRSGRVAEARALAGDLLAKFPAHVPLRLQVAAVLCDGGDFAGAEQLAQEALAAEPGNAEARALLDRARARQGR